MTSSDIQEWRCDLDGSAADRFVVVLSSAQQTAPLRRAVLRPHFQLDQMGLAGDESPDTVYLAVHMTDSADKILGCARLEPNPCPWPLTDSARQAAWQLRAMATDPSARGTGMGRRIVQAAVTYVAERDGDLIWCNARMSARGFYACLGFRAVTDSFFVPDTPDEHVGMLLDVQRAVRWSRASQGMTGGADSPTAARSGYSPPGGAEERKRLTRAARHDTAHEADSR